MMKSLNLTPLTRKRIGYFKENRRAYWSLIIFGMLFILTLFAEFLSNDRPLLFTPKEKASFPGQNFIPSLPLVENLKRPQSIDPLIF